MTAPTFDNSYARLGAGFFARTPPVPVADPGPIAVNGELATRLADWQPSAPEPRGGYAQIFHDHVQGADTGADFDFLIGCRGADVGKDSH